MTSQKTVLLDFDGTVADSFAMAVDIAQTLLKAYEYPVPTQEEIFAMRELSAAQIIKAAKISPRHIPAMVKYVRGEQKSRINTVKPIHGIEPVLKQLAKSYHLGIVSSSDAPLIQNFLKKYELDHVITSVIGGAGIFQKHRSIRRYMKKHKLHNDDVVYIGDEARDVDAARKARVGSISVNWGFNGMKPLTKAGPDILVTKVSDLAAAVNTMFSNNEDD